MAGMSRNHAYRMMEAYGFVEQLKTLPRGNVFPHSRNLLLTERGGKSALGRRIDLRAL